MIDGDTTEEVSGMAKKEKSNPGKKTLKLKDLSARGEGAKVKGGAVGPCFDRNK